MIFMYHNVVPEKASPGHDQQSITLRETQFLKQVKSLRRIFHFVSLEDYLSDWHIKGKQPITKAVLTIDDGTWSTFEYGVRHLMDLKIPSLIFTNTCQLDDGPLIWGAYLNALCFESELEYLELEGQKFLLTNVQERYESRRQLVKLARTKTSPQSTVLSWSEKYPIAEKILKYYKGLSSEQLRECGDSPFVEIGVHTHSHPFLSTLSKEEQRKEILTNREILAEKTKDVIRFLAYPSGDYNQDTLDLMKELDFSAACAVHMDGSNKDLKYQLPRVGVYSPSTLRVLAAAAKNRLKLKGLHFEE